MLIAGAPSVVVLVLAGGRATRFPGKLAQPVGGEPLLAGVVERMRTCAPVILCGDPGAGIVHDVMIIEDRTPGAGPLQALCDAFEALQATLVVVVAGDMPNAGAPLFRHLLDAYRAGDEAVVAEHDERKEPLAALYERAAFVRAARAALGEGVASMHGMLERLRARVVAAPSEWFININYRADLAALPQRGSTTT